MISRSKLSERLREYRIISKYYWDSFAAALIDSATSRMDATSVIWERIILSLIIIATCSVYFRCLLLTFSLELLAFLLVAYLKIMQVVRLFRQRNRRMLSLSM